MAASPIDVISLAMSVRKQCETAGASRKLLAVVGRKMDSLLPVVSKIQASGAAESSSCRGDSDGDNIIISRVLDELKSEIDASAKLVTRAKTMSRVVFIVRAGGLREDVERNLKAIHLSLMALEATRNDQIASELRQFHAAWCQRQEELRLEAERERRAKSDLAERVEEANNDPASSSAAAGVDALADVAGFDSAGATTDELERALDEMRRERDVARTELNDAVDSVVRNKMEQEAQFMDQFIAFLEAADKAERERERQKQRQRQQQQQQGAGGRTQNLPDECICPITAKPMIDPVIVDAVCKHTVSREGFEQWIEDGNTVCPIDRTELKSKNVAPNAPLRNLIERMLGPPGRDDALLLSVTQETQRATAEQEFVAAAEDSVAEQSSGARQAVRAPAVTLGRASSPEPSLSSHRTPTSAIDEMDNDMPDGANISANNRGEESPAENPFVSAAIDLVTQAISADKAGEYERAAQCYNDALSKFNMAIENEKDEGRKRLIMERAEGYINRSKELRVFLNKQADADVEGGGDTDIKSNEANSSIDDRDNDRLDGENASSNDRGEDAPAENPFISEGIVIVKNAVDADTLGEYERALPYYNDALRKFDMGLELETNEERKALIMERCEGYRKRAEALQDFLHKHAATDVEGSGMVRSNEAIFFVGHHSVDLLQSGSDDKFPVEFDIPFSPDSQAARDKQTKQPLQHHQVNHLAKDKPNAKARPKAEDRPGQSGRNRTSSLQEVWKQLALPGNVRHVEEKRIELDLEEDSNIAWTKQDVGVVVNVSLQRQRDQENPQRVRYARDIQCRILERLNQEYSSKTVGDSSLKMILRVQITVCSPGNLGVRYFTIYGGLLGFGHPKLGLNYCLQSVQGGNVNTMVAQRLFSHGNILEQMSFLCGKVHLNDMSDHMARRIIKDVSEIQSKSSIL